MITRRSFIKGGLAALVLYCGSEDNTILPRRRVNPIPNNDSVPYTPENTSQPNYVPDPASIPKPDGTPVTEPSSEPVDETSYHPPEPLACTSDNCYEVRTLPVTGDGVATVTDTVSLAGRTYNLEFYCIGDRSYGPSTGGTCYVLNEEIVTAAEARGETITGITALDRDGLRLSQGHCIPLEDAVQLHMINLNIPCTWENYCGTPPSTGYDVDGTMGSITYCLIPPSNDTPPLE